MSETKPSAQEVTLQQYHQWMQINSMSHLMRVARESGIVAALRDGQRTGEQLCEQLSIDRNVSKLVLDALVAIGIVEKYDEDYALARAAHLLCQYDDDLGDASWQTLGDLLDSGRNEFGDSTNDQEYLNSLAATQWAHTGAAMQASEILDLAGESQVNGSQGKAFRILDFGCGSAVFSCALAYDLPTASVVAVDHAASLQAAQSMADSIELGERFEPIEADVVSGIDVNSEIWARLREGGAFDLAVIAQRLSALSDDAARELLAGVISTLTPSGTVIVVDVFRGPHKPTLTESIGALRVALGTSQGRVRDLREAQGLLAEAGLGGIQFTYLAASRDQLGMIVGKRV